MNSKLLRKLPKVDELLMDEEVREASCGLLREQVVDVIRTVIENIRKDICVMLPTSHNGYRAGRVPLGHSENAGNEFFGTFMFVLYSGPLIVKK